MYQKVVDVLKEFTKVQPEEISPQSSLIVDLGLNSLGLMRIVMAFESAFDVEISDRQIAGLRTVEDIIQVLGTQKKK